MEYSSSDIDPASTQSTGSEAISNILSTANVPPSSFRFDCNLCEKYSLTREPIVNHIRSEHNIDNVRVTEHFSPCYMPPEPKKIITIAAPAAKFAVHFVCNYCDKYYTTTTNVKKHIKLIHHFQSVSSEHYSSCIKQSKPSRTRPTESANVKPKSFITPVRAIVQVSGIIGGSNALEAVHGEPSVGLPEPQVQHLSHILREC